MNWLGLLLSTGRLPSNSGEHKGDNKNAKFEHQMAPLRNLACGARIVVILMFLFVVASLVSALVHEKSKRILNMKQQEKYANALVLPAMMDQAKHYWSQAKEGLQLRRLSSKESKLDAEAADRYFEAQLPHFKKSMQGYPLHSHFANIQLPSKISFHDMIKARGELLVRQLEENGWEDFKIEKDKCAMFQFLKYNGLPHVDWLEIYRGFNDLESVLPKIRKQLLDQKDFPMFIKSCHITTGAAKSVRKVASRQEVEENWGTLSEWAQNMWSYRSNDWERIWAKPFNILCGALKPGFMVQHPWKVGRQEFPEEIKVEVIWGRAYLAFVSTGKCGGDTIILRDGSVTRYTDSLMQNVLHQGKPDPCYRWIVDEGHLPRVWFMAESAARLMGIDAIRIDVFVLKGDPMASVINEDSLSSGAEYRWHFQHMADLWAMGHREKGYKAVDPGVDSHMWWRGRDHYSMAVASCNQTLIAKSASSEICK